ncbi:hypothetical protein DMUE_2884 [Dictyocoela muelleri]|nr:hypothetical protein DMUE_2884 [Dictyocoela muelleri]
MLDNIERQDIFKWRNEFLQTAQIAGWTSESAGQVLISLISTEYFYLVSGLNDVEDVMKAIFRFKYPAKDHVKYLNQLSNIKRNNFLRIREFRDEIINTTNKLSVCLDWNNEMKKSKIKEAFYYGLSRRTQLEMICLNIHDIDSM